MATTPRRQMSLVGFMQAGSTTRLRRLVAPPRHRARVPRLRATTRSSDARSKRAASTCMFFDDRLAMPGIYGGSVADAVRLGARPVKLDLSMVLGVVAGATRTIGLGATYSTTYYSPFHVARTFATLDHLSARAGRLERRDIGQRRRGPELRVSIEHLGHDERYDRADEFLEATTGLWDTWEDDALVLDRASGRFADPDKVHELQPRRVTGSSVRGPLTVPRSPQGRPVLLQAGSSGRGRDFAARWAELIFTGDPDIDIARSHYKDQKERIAVRRPGSAIRCKMLPMAYTVVGESRAQAEEREQLFLHDLVDPRRR